MGRKIFDFLAFFLRRRCNVTRFSLVISIFRSVLGKKYLGTRCRVKRKKTVCISKLLYAISYVYLFWPYSFPHGFIHEVNEIRRKNRISFLCRPEESDYRLYASPTKFHYSYDVKLYSYEKKRF